MRRISCIGRDDGSGGVYTNTTLHDGGHYTARRRSLHCTTAVTTLHDAALRGAARTSTGPIRGGGRLRHQLVWRGFIHPLHRGPTRLHEYVGVHVVGLNLAVDRMHAWVQWWNNSSAHSNAEHYLWLPIRARLVPTRRTSRVNMDKMDKVRGEAAARQHSNQVNPERWRGETSSGG